MTAFFDGTAFASVGINDNYNGATKAYWLMWLKPFDLVSHGTPWAEETKWDFTVLNDRLIVSIGTAVWTSAAGFLDATLQQIAVHFDGTQTGDNKRLKVSRNGVDRTAQGAFSGTAVPATLDSDFLLATLGINVDTELLYHGCLGQLASYTGSTFTFAQDAEAFALGASGNLAASTLGTPQDWYKLVTNFADSGTGPTFDGPDPPVAGITLNSCPGLGPTVELVDVDLSLEIKRRYSPPT
jgi:hypothetical protein